jgi:hypothetical protein
MSCLTVAAAVALLCGSLSTTAAQQPRVPSVDTEITYDNFVKLAPEIRRRQFQRLTVEHKALIKRTHAERWLTTNRTRLSEAQIAVSNEAIEFLTPQIYLRPDDPGIVKQEQRIKQKLTCILGHDNARQAFMIDAPSTRSDGSTGSMFDAWLSWFSECVAR